MIPSTASVVENGVINLKGVIFLLPIKETSQNAQPFALFAFFANQLTLLCSFLLPLTKTSVKPLWANLIVVVILKILLTTTKPDIVRKLSSFLLYRKI
jgi:hypothetical protein